MALPTVHIVTRFLLETGLAFTVVGTNSIETLCVWWADCLILCTLVDVHTGVGTIRQTRNLMARGTSADVSSDSITADLSFTAIVIPCCALVNICLNLSLVYIKIKLVIVLYFINSNLVVTHLHRSWLPDLVYSRQDTAVNFHSGTTRSSWCIVHDSGKVYSVCIRLYLVTITILFNGTTLLFIYSHIYQHMLLNDYVGILVSTVDALSCNLARNSSDYWSVVIRNDCRCYLCKVAVLLLLSSLWLLALLL